MDFDNFNFDNDEITNLTKDLHELIEGGLHIFNQEQMEVVQKRMQDLIEQSLFWLKQENPKRFAYDLRQFLYWMSDYIGEIEGEFWGEEESS